MLRVLVRVRVPYRVPSTVPFYLYVSELLDVTSTVPKHCPRVVVDRPPARPSRRHSIVDSRVEQRVRVQYPALDTILLIGGVSWGGKYGTRTTYVPTK